MAEVILRLPRWASYGFQIQKGNGELFNFAALLMKSKVPNNQKQPKAWYLVLKYINECLCISISKIDRLNSI